MLVTRNGWGVVTAAIQASQVQGGTNVVVGNNGVGILINAGNIPLRLVHLGWRVDIAPDVAPGSVNAPDKYRLVVLRGASALPPDVSAFQNSAGYVNEPSIPNAIQSNAPLDVLWDEWLDASVSFPGLDIVSTREFSDAGPTVNGREMMIILLVPVIAPLAQVVLSPTNAVLHLVAYGTTGGAANAYGSNDISGASSLPRYDIRKPE